MPDYDAIALAGRLERARDKSRPNFVTEMPAEFIERFMLDDMTGRPIELVPEQRAVLDAMFERDADDNLLFDTMLYSATKKSGKTAVGGSVALWQAWREVGDLYIIGNDLKQADNRMAQFIRYTLENNPVFAGQYRIVRYTVYLSNGSVIHAIPVDPEGEAGMNPIGLFWTEAWGARHGSHERLWTEAALSPHRIGKSFKFVESYAGYKNTSMVLWRLYENIWKNGTPHPADPELRVNGTSIAWWCTRKLLPGQRGKMGERYYKGERLRLLPEEYNRQHENVWADTLSAFVNIHAWDNCRGEIPEPGQYETAVIAVDASVSGDCTAVVLVTRQEEMVYVRDVKIWTPQPGEKINYEEVEGYILGLKERYQSGPIVYDPYQMEYMSERLEKSGHWVESFAQGSPRLRADKSLRDRIVNGMITHPGDPELRRHVENASAQIDKEDGKLRIVKSNSIAKVDGLVALSMAAHIAETLDIG